MNSNFQLKIFEENSIFYQKFSSNFAVRPNARMIHAGFLKELKTRKNNRFYQFSYADICKFSKILRAIRPPPEGPERRPSPVSPEANPSLQPCDQMVMAKICI